ncbi:pentapeptide repeat protein [Taylorella asinigenitalis 14/45]|uniref:Pentapeptide repeat protein n=1 Tax=Taylorella asinigenitalis 14/45 TaxID=1091495 RepID=I7JNL4_9BURK|nr:DUF2169 domain-containing protein [Taylorella asinigenitalis]CCG20115.1 pentapeptide repeat protein [Taylorella asinigenitalis 14/45]
MKITKPTSISLQVRPYRWRGESRIGLSILVMVDASSLTPVLETESKLWDTAKAEMDCGGAIEYGIPKVNPEFLVSGKAFSAFSPSNNELDVTVKVNDKTKQLRVFGDRLIQDGKISKAEAFEEMSLNWSNSYGGEGYSNNPLGKGWISESQSNEPKYMPNVEHPHDLIIDLKKEYKTYNFGPQNMTWPIRFEKIGNFSEEWKKLDFPGFFPDMDPTIFNAAQSDQIWDDLDFLPNNCQFAVTNMNSEKQIWRGVTPAWNGKCYVVLQKDKNSNEELLQATLRLKTLWLLPNLEKYLLIFQESIPCWYEDGSEIKHILAALEWSYSPKPEEHYLYFISLREDHYSSALTAYKDEDLLPENVDYKGLTPEPNSLGEMSEKLIKYQEYIKRISREHLKEMGLNADYYLPQEVGPQPRANLKYLPEKQKWQDDRADQLRLHFEKVKEARKKFLLTNGSDKELNELTGSDKFYETVKRDFDNLDSNKDLSHTKFSKYQGLVKNLNTNVDPRLERLEKKALSMSSHYDLEGFKLTDNAIKCSRDSLINRVDSKLDTTGLYLSNIDLSNLVFKNLDFSLTIFRNVNLSNSTFENCVFNDSAFSFANFDNTSFVSCEFKSPNFSQTHLTNATFHKSSFEKFVTLNNEIENSNFVSCKFKDCMWQDTNLKDSKFFECTFEAFMVLESQLINCDFTNSELVRGSLSACKVLNCKFCESYITRFALTNIELSYSDFSKSRIKALSVISEAPLKNINFSESFIENSSLRKLNFIECTFNSASIINSELSFSSFENCNAKEIQIPDSVLRVCTFDMVDFSNSNFIGGTFTRSSFSQVNFTHVNFFRCEMGMTVINDYCIEHENYMTQIQLEPSEREI